MNNIQSPIIQGLSSYRDENILRFHMPGHYGKSSFPELNYLCDNLFSFDVTEVDGTDNLNHPQEMILDSLNKLSSIYQSKQSFILVNGSTSGIHIAIDTLVDDGGCVIAARNCHKSVYNILDKKNVCINYIYPVIDDEFYTDSHINYNELINMIDDICNSNSTPVSAVILTCPNYFGRTFELEPISRYLQQKNIYLIIDEAHGAHFPFSPYLPKSAISQGATIAIQSAHKTLPALTQTAMMHLGENFPDSKLQKLKNNINFYQTTSPSYILMASCETAVDIMNKYGTEGLNNIKIWIDKAKLKLTSNPDIKIYDNSISQDFCKLAIKTPILGADLSKILRKEYKIQCEMTMGLNILFMIGLTHTENDINYLVNSIIDALKNNRHLYCPDLNYYCKNPYPKTVSCKKPFLTKTGSMKKTSIITKIIQDVNGDICAEQIVPYPPGVPLLMPYEIINKDMKIALEYHKFSEIKCFMID
ncbi:MAG: hypothetical protein WBH44_09705 [Proteocatella sp.]